MLVNIRRRNRGFNMLLRGGALCVLGALMAFQAVSGQVADLSGPNIIEIRLATPFPRSGFVHMEGVGIQRALHVSAHAVVTDGDIKRADACITPDGLALALRLTLDARARLMTATAENIGMNLAILINGRLVYGPVIRAPGGEFDIRLHIDHKRLDEIALENLTERINERWKPLRPDQDQAEGMNCPGIAGDSNPQERKRS